MNQGLLVGRLKSILVIGAMMIRLEGHNETGSKILQARKS